MPTIVPDRITAISLEEATRAFADGWNRAVGWEPKARQLAVMIAHCILENGDGFRALHNFGFGNAKASKSYAGLCCFYRCNEIIDGKVVWFNPPTDEQVASGKIPAAAWGCAFRAYASAAEGAAEHVRFLAVDTNHDGHNRYAAAWAKLCAGDAGGFVRALKNSGYFTGPTEAYVRAVGSIADRIGSACDKALTREPQGITSEDRDHIAGQVALFLSEQRGAFAEPFPLPDEIA